MRTSLRETAIKRPIACSDTSIELQPAALQTLMPNSSAAWRSMRSTPTPVRQTTLQRFSWEMISRVNGTEPCMMMPSASRPASATSASLRGLAMIISASISSRIRLISGTGTSLLPKYFTRNFAIVLSSQSEQAHGIVPENLSSHVARQFVVAAQIADGAVGEFIDRVAVRVIRRDHQPLVAHVLDIHRGELFSGLA